VVFLADMFNVDYCVKDGNGYKYNASKLDFLSVGIVWMQKSRKDDMKPILAVLLLCSICAGQESAEFYLERKDIMPKTLTVAEAAQSLGCTYGWILTLIHSHKLKGKRVGRTYRVDADSVAKRVEAQKAGGR
jgi:excisionase family DNA binding protein